METICKTKTPFGTYEICFGEFIGPKYRGKYHCWWNGCGIGGESDSLAVTREYLAHKIRSDAVRELSETVAKAEEIASFLDQLLERHDFPEPPK